MTNNEMHGPGVGARAAQDVLDASLSVPEPEAFDYETWRADVEDKILSLAATGREFDSEDVRALGVSEAIHPNLWGQVYSYLHAEGWIEPNGWHASGRRTMRGGAVRLWRGTRKARKAGREAA